MGKNEYYEFDDMLYQFVYEQDELKMIHVMGSAVDLAETSWAMDSKEIEPEFFKDSENYKKLKDSFLHYQETQFKSSVKSHVGLFGEEE